MALILFAVSLLSFAGVIAIASWTFRKGPLSKEQERISRFVSPVTDVNLPNASLNTLGLPDMDAGKLRNWINESLGGFSSQKLQKKISSAYWPITDTEFILIRIISTLLLFFMGWLIPGNLLGGIIFSAIAIMVPNLILDRTIAQRQKKFHTQLLDVLIMIKGAVQAGYSLMQSLDVAIKEIPVPASEEFGRVLRETRLGYSLENALFNLAERMENDDMQIVVTAIVINAQVGGNLSTVLEATIATIRDRMQLMSEIRSLTSYSRFVGGLLTLLPFAVAAIIFMLSPVYFETVKTSSLTQTIFIMAFIGIIIGNIVMARIMKIRV